MIVENLHGDVYWYKNSGTPAKDPVWQKFTITRHTIPGAYDVALADLDGDGDLITAPFPFGEQRAATSMSV